MASGKEVVLIYKNDKEETYTMPTTRKAASNKLKEFDNDNNIKAILTAALSSGTVTYSFDGTSFTTFVYTATSGQTSFSGADGNGNTLAYSAGKRNVYLNGVLLDESDITASNGTSVVLASGAAASDILTVIAFAVNNIAVLDANGSEFILDADGDTSITADSDDEIDFKVGGTDTVKIKAQTLSAPAIIEMADDIAANLTVTSGKNALAVGPLTIATGVTVTVPSGQTMVVL